MEQSWTIDPVIPVRKNISAKHNSQPLLGAHVSIAGGVEKAPGRGRKLTCDCIQIFSKNQNQWKAKPLTQESVLQFKDNLSKHKILSVAVHDSYLINLASPDSVKLQMSIKAFMDEIDRAEQLGITKLIFHPGSHMGQGENVGLNRIADNLNSIIDKRPESKVKLLIETTAGQGTNLGYRFEHLAKIIELVDDKARMRVCYDTQHTFAAGYDLSTKGSYNQVWNEFDNTIGIEKLTAFHLNDSKKALSSRRDRHEQIGKGLIGLNAFKLLLNDPRFENIPMFLETPQGEEKYLSELNTLRSLIGQ